jgi:hypothetical protein
MQGTTVGKKSVKNTFSACTVGSTKGIRQEYFEEGVVLASPVCDERQRNNQF